MSRRAEVARLRAERDAARQSADLMAEQLRLRKNTADDDRLRLAVRLEHAESLLRAQGIDPGPVARPLPPREWLDRQNLAVDHPVRIRQGVVL